MNVIAVIDYGAGNLQSVLQGLARLGEKATITRDPAAIAAASGVILPGVGAFGDAMRALTQSGVIPAMTETIARGVPLLGICLGMQMFFDSSEESPGIPGLGWLPGTVQSLRNMPTTDGLKIPHMGWNTLTPHQPSPLLDGISAADYVYFVHSYACVPTTPSDILATTSYGTPFCAAVQRGNLIGMQYHPEKSGRTGATMLTNFLRLCAQ